MSELGDEAKLLHDPMTEGIYTELNDFLLTLDKRADEQRGKIKHHAAERKPREQGSDANTNPPLNPPKWTVNKDWRKSYT